MNIKNGLLWEIVNCVSFGNYESVARIALQVEAKASKKTLDDGARSGLYKDTARIIDKELRHFLALSSPWRVASFLTALTNHPLILAGIKSETIVSTLELLPRHIQPETMASSQQPDSVCGLASIVTLREGEYLYNAFVECFQKLPEEIRQKATLSASQSTSRNTYRLILEQKYGISAKPRVLNEAMPAF